jgi:hypothetical protein
LAFFQAFRAYGHSPTILTAHPVPSQMVLYGNIPSVIYDPEFETDPSSSWTAADPSTIKKNLVDWIDMKSQTSVKDDIIAICLMSHGSMRGTIQLGTITDEDGLDSNNSMSSHELFERMRDGFPNQKVYLILDYCFAGREANNFAPSFFKSRAGAMGPKTIIYSSAFRISYSNLFANGSMFSTEMVKSLITSRQRSRRTTLQQHQEVMASMKSVYDKTHCTPTLHLFPPKLGQLRERDFVFRVKHDTEVDYSEIPILIPLRATIRLQRRLQRRIPFGIAAILEKKAATRGYSHLKHNNSQCNYAPVP